MGVSFHDYGAVFARKHNRLFSLGYVCVLHTINLSLYLMISTASFVTAEKFISLRRPCLMQMSSTRWLNAWGNWFWCKFPCQCTLNCFYMSSSYIQLQINAPELRTSLIEEELYNIPHYPSDLSWVCFFYKLSIYW